jgi:radical SAM superfamily enzyme YgiQ (UPF0313 family)
MARVALIGPDQQDNLPLRYLAASLAAAGYGARLVRFNGRFDQKRCIDQVMSDPPDLVGLGISFQHNVTDYLNLACELRRSGFKGHITCGGHVPTFCFREILEEETAIDSVVRHEGEDTLVALVEALDAPSFAGIQGLAWCRDGEVIVEAPRPPVTDLDTLPRPELREGGPLVVGGVPIAFIITARGCYGACTYCSIQAFSRDAGGPRLRLRDVSHVADEVADHHRRYNTRTFFFQDDLFILSNKKRTLSRMAALEAALEERGVEDAVFWIKARPESINHEVAAAARAFGAVHIFLGVENASDARLAYLGRTHRHHHNRRAIEICEAHGIRPSFNLMLFDPDCTLADVSCTMDFAASVPKLPWNICRTEIYSGTPLKERLLTEGRLEGDYRNYGYRMSDDAAETMFRILRVSMKERAFATSSILNKLISISFARQAHEAFFPGPATCDLSDKVDTLVADVHVDTLEELGRARDFAAKRAIDDVDAIRDFAVAQALRVNRKNAFFYARFRNIWSVLNARGAARYGKPRFGSAPPSKRCG